MQIVQASRASAILYNLLKSQGGKLPWLLPANICPIVPITFFKAGRPFEFVDISVETLHMDLKQAERRLMRGGVGGVLYAHTYGEPSTPEAFFRQIKSYDPDILLVDDRCLCLPDLEADAGMAADVALYSTGYAKIVDLGFGGYSFLKEHVGYNHSRLPFEQEALAQIENTYKQAIREHRTYVYQDSNWLQSEVEMPAWYDFRHRIEVGLEQSVKQRAHLNQIYTDRLPLEIQLSQTYQTWRFNIRLNNQRQTLEAIFSAGLHASSHYASLAGVMAPGRCPQAETLADEVINLLNNHFFDAQKAEQVCAIIVENLP